MLTEQNIKLFKETFTKLFSVSETSFDTETENSEIVDIYCLNKGVGILVDGNQFVPYATSYDSSCGHTDVFELGNALDNFRMAMIELLKEVITDEFDAILDWYRYEEQNDFLF